MPNLDQYTQLKNRVIVLRNDGYTYTEILTKVPIARSTLAIWLKEAGLAETQSQPMTERKRLSALRGAQRRKDKRIKKMGDIFEACRSDISNITDRELWLIGIALYWAEGSKEKEYHPGRGVCFSNSDARMIKFFLTWLDRCVKVSTNNISYDLFIHETSRHRIEEVIEFWQKELHVNDSSLIKVYWKNATTKTKRHNIGNLYYGCLQVKVKASSSLLRQIAGWTEAIVGVVT